MIYGGYAEMRVLKGKLLIIFCLLWVYCIPQAIYGAESIEKTLSLDSLFLIVQANNGKPQVYQYTTQLLEEAQHQKNQTQIANAYFSYVRYYYAKNPDSMYYWMQQALPLFLDQKRYEEYFRMKAWYVYVLTRAKKNDEVLQSINQIKEQAEELGYLDGIDMANQALADFYLSNNLCDEGVALYEEILRSMEMRNAPLIKRINIIRQLMNKPRDLNVKMKYIHRLEEYVKICHTRKIEKIDEENPVYFLEYVVHRHYAVEYILMGKLKEAMQHIQQAQKLLNKYEMFNYQSELQTIYASYYHQSKQYDKAIALYDSLLYLWKTRNSMSAYLEVMKNKAEILDESGRYKQAVQVYQEYAVLNDSLSKVRYYKELAEMKTQHEVDKLELQNKQMDLEVTEAHSQMLKMGGGLGFLFLLCCLLGYISYSRHRYGLQLKLAKEKAEEADHLKSAFLANMNHEIRTPLNAIVGFSQILIDEEDVETRQEYANIIQNNNELLQRLITDVLDLSKIESNTMTLHYAEYELSVLMKEIYNVILMRMPEGVELQLNNCPQQLFYTDRNRLTQILTNLLTNAIKHTEKGFIRLGYEATATDVVFSVEDSGEGIPEDKLEKIFSRFVQLNDWSKGVGLGLAICKGLISQMGGTISVSSQFGIGSTFIVTLPLKKP